MWPFCYHQALKVFTRKILSRGETRPRTKSSLSLVKCLLLFTHFCRDEISFRNKRTLTVLGNCYSQSFREISRNADACNFQKQPFRGVLSKRCSENMQQNYRRTPMQKCHFNKVAWNFIEITLRHGCSPGNFLDIFRTPFTKNTSGWLLLNFKTMALLCSFFSGIFSKTFKTKLSRTPVKVCRGTFEPLKSCNKRWFIKYRHFRLPKSIN